MDFFSMDFWLFWIYFLNVLFKVIIDFKFDKRCFFKDYRTFGSIFVSKDGVLCAKKKSMGMGSSL